ncbi:MAG: hypothetical protein HOC74_10100 [Gemmatimonadetes bacterium]|jgi:hypothetical protein|nr:hypothetical protein [Gemmatimonadota bacterium]
MAGNQNPRYARVALESMMTNDLPAFLAAIDTEIDDGITLEPIARYYEAPLADYDTFPAALILSESTQYPDEDRSDDIRFHEIQLQVFIYSIEKINGLLPGEIANERLERTMTAIDQMIEANSTLLVSGTHNADICLQQNVAYSDFTPREGGVLRAALMNLEVYFSS